MSRIIAIANQKGGVGKTTTTINLATAMAACDKKVLVIDFDPQGNASTGLGIDKNNIAYNIYDAMIEDCTVAQATNKTDVPNLDVVPATVDLSGAEIELASMVAREFKLKNILEGVSAQYDYIFIDCPPSLGLLTINGLTAADEVMVPLQTEFFAMEGISQLIRTIKLVKKALNPSLELMGVLLTMFDKRNKLSFLVADDVRAFFGEQVFNTFIPRNVRISEAPSHGKPVLLYDTACAGSVAYMHLAAEILRKGDGPTSGTKVSAQTVSEGIQAAA